MDKLKKTDETIIHSVSKPTSNDIAKRKTQQRIEKIREQQALEQSVREVWQ